MQQRRSIHWGRRGEEEVMGNSRTQLFSGLGVGIGVDIGTVAASLPACLPACLGGAHNSSCPVNWLVWLLCCLVRWLADCLVSGMVCHTVAGHLALYCFSAARFCYVNCNTMLTGGPRRQTNCFRSGVSLFVFGFFIIWNLWAYLALSRETGRAE